MFCSWNTSRLGSSGHLMSMLVSPSSKSLKNIFSIHTSGTVTLSALNFLTVLHVKSQPQMFHYCHLLRWNSMDFKVKVVRDKDTVELCIHWLRIVRTDLAGTVGRQAPSSSRFADGKHRTQCFLLLSPAPKTLIVCILVLYCLYHLLFVLL